MTTVGDIHSDTAWIIAQRAAQKSGVMQGPRLFVSGARVLGPLLEGPPRAFGAGYVRDVAEARAYVRYLAAIGVDMVKVDSTITDEQLEAVIDEARKFRLPVLGHLRDIDVAMRFGMKEMEHLPPFLRAQLVREGKPLPQAGSEEGAELLLKVDPAKFAPLIRQMVEQNVIVDIALYGWVPREIWRAARPELERLANDPRLAFVPDAEKKAWVTDPGAPRPGAETVAVVHEAIHRGRRQAAGLERRRRQQSHRSGFRAASHHAGHDHDGRSGDGDDPGLDAVARRVAGHRRRTTAAWKSARSRTSSSSRATRSTNIAATRNIRTVIQGGKVMDTTYDPNWVNPVPRPTNFERR